MDFVTLFSKEGSAEEPRPTIARHTLDGDLLKPLDSSLIKVLSVSESIQPVVMDFESGEPFSKIYKLNSNFKEYLLQTVVVGPTVARFKKLNKFLDTLGSTGVSKKHYGKFKIGHLDISGWVNSRSYTLKGSSDEYIELMIKVVGLDSNKFNLISKGVFGLKKRLFINHVEVKAFHRMDINSNLGGVPTASILLEPDIIMSSLNPMAPVIIYEQNYFDSGRWDLVFEGYVMQTSGANSATNVYLNITCQGSLGRLGAGSPLLSTLGNLQYTSVWGGTLFEATPGGGAVTVPLMLSSSILNAINKKGTFLDGIKDFLEKISKFNIASIYGLFKSNAYDTTFALDSDLLNKVAELDILSSIGKNQSVGEDDTVFDILKRVLSKFSYTITQVLYPPVSGEGERSYYVNNLIMPDISYAVAPPCNWVFPSTIKDYTFSENFLSQPTRKVAVVGKDQGLNQGVVSPSIEQLYKAYSVWRADTKARKIQDMYSVFLGTDVDSENLSKLRFSIPLGKGKKVKDVNFTALPVELVKGVIPSTGLPAFAWNYALAKLNISKEKYSKSSQIEKAKVDKNAKGVFDFIKEMLDFYLFKESRGVSATVIVKGNRYITPGFPIFIFDKYTPLYGMVTSVSYAYDVTGSDTITVQVENCVKVSSFLEGDPLTGVNKFKVPSWGVDSLVSISAAFFEYSRILGTKPEEVDDLFLFTDLDNYFQVFTKEKFYNLSFDKALEFNRREVESKQQLSFLLLDKESSYGHLWSMGAGVTASSLLRQVETACRKKYSEAEIGKEYWEGKIKNRIIDYNTKHEGGVVLFHNKFTDLPFVGTSHYLPLPTWSKSSLPD